MEQVVYWEREGAVRVIMLNQSFSSSLQDHLHNEARLITISGAAPDFTEGTAAFIAKRKPTFTGQ